MVIKQSSSIIEARENENVENRESITWPDTKGWNGTEKTSSTTMKVDSSLVLYYTSPVFGLTAEDRSSGPCRGLLSVARTLFG
jgi:hypothetical protein